MADKDKEKVYKQVTNAPEWTVLDRMRQLGYWPWGQGLPEEPKAEREERQQLEARSKELSQTQTAAQDVEAALKKERLRRMEESRAKRKQRQKEKAQARELSKKAYQARLKGDVVHLGLGVSGQLEQRQSDEAKLKAAGLPVIHTAHELSRALSVTLAQLRFLTYHRAGAPLVHYRRFILPKKTGGERHISAPKPTLARVQQWIYAEILSKPPPSAVAHGFVPGRNVLSNALPHLKKKVVFNLDLKDFFPTLAFHRVRGLFKGLGYSGQVATLLALLCTEPPRVEMKLDEKTYWVALGDRVLPQGACTSPALTNLACRRLDKRLARLGEVNGFTFTRYADDLTFSGDSSAHVGRLLKSVRSIVASEGFIENEKKTHVMRSGRRQEVTGVVVNQKPTIGRTELRTLRAVLHNAAKHGLKSQNRAEHPDFAAYLRGRVAWAISVDPSKKPQLDAALKKALARGG